MKLRTRLERVNALSRTEFSRIRRNSMIASVLLTLVFVLLIETLA